MRATWKGSGLRCLVLRRHTGQVQHGWAVDKEMRDRQVASMPSPGHPTHPQPTVFPSQASPLPSTLAHGPHELRLASFKAHFSCAQATPAHVGTLLPGTGFFLPRLLCHQDPMCSVCPPPTTFHAPPGCRGRGAGSRCYTACKALKGWLCAPCGYSCHSPTERST